MTARKTILLGVVLSCCVSLAHADTLTLESGRSLEGRIVERTDEFVRVMVDGREELFLASEIASINGQRYDSPVLTDYWELVDNVRDADSERETFRGSVSVIGSSQEEPDRSPGFNAQIEKQMQSAIKGVARVRSRSTRITSRSADWEELFESWPVLVIVILLAVALGYVYPCYCLMLIARKTHTGSGWLAWIPIANLFLMFRVGGLSYLWMLSFFTMIIPLVGPFVVMGVMVYLWYSIVVSRSKPGWLVALLFVPFGYWILLGILAFTDGAAESDSPEGGGTAMEKEKTLEIKIERYPQVELESRGVFSWPVWEKEVSRFDWHYDQTEECYLLEGEVVVEYGAGKKVLFGKGDFVVFPKGLSCVWDIKKPVKKHYNFT